MPTVTTTFTSVTGASGTNPRAADSVGTALVVRANRAFLWTAVGTVDAGCRVFLDYSDNGGASWGVLREWGPGAVSEGATERFQQPRSFRCRASVDNTCTLASFAFTFTESTELLKEWIAADGTLVARLTSGGAEVPTLTATTATVTTVSTDTVSEKTSAAGVTLDGVKLKDSEVYTDVVNEKTSTAGVYIDGVKLKDGAVYMPVGAPTPAVALGFGTTTTSGAQVKIIDQTVSFAGNAALYKAMTTPIPAGAVILSVQANVQAALTGGSTTVKVGLGPNASDPDKYGKTSDLTQNQKIDTVPAWTVLSAQEAIDVCACATDGSAGDTALTVGSVRVRIVYLALTSLQNA